jgi:exopolysaccharide biosynthesis polyprenyl glycosylphosphotransferase
MLAVLFVLLIVGGYDRRTDMMSLTYMSEHLIGLVAAFVLALLLVYCFASYDFPVKPGRSTMLLSFLAFAPLSLLYRRAVGARVRAGMARKHFLVLGSGPVAQNFFKSYLHSASRQSLRFFDLEISSQSALTRTGKHASDEDEILAELDLLGAETEGIVVTIPVSQISAELRDRLVRIHFQQTPVYTLDSFYETYWRRVPVFALDPAWPLQIGFHLARASPYNHFKRCCDVVSATAGLLLLSPLFALIALLTLWDSGRPIIFSQERVGRGGKPFTIYKFRSMRARPSVATDDGDLYTRPNDARITRVGRWLRKLRLDELPQLWNVLRGDMSLIGPRAEWVKCAERYEGKIPSYHFRHLVKPGITGWAQVNYAYGENEEDALQKLKYDLYYIRRYSLRLDAMIVLKTLHIMFWGKGQ